MKEWASKTFGSFANRFYRFFYIGFALVSFIPVYALVYLLPDQQLYSLSSPWSILFNLLRLASAVLLFISAYQTGLLQFLGISQALGNTTDGQLQTNGLYKYMRHPIYTFTITFFLFSPSMSQNSAAFYLAIMLYSIIGAFYEERKLVAMYGKVYEDYQAKTPMLIPFFGGKSNP